MWVPVQHPYIILVLLWCEPRDIAPIACYSTKPFPCRAPVVMSIPQGQAPTCHSGPKPPTAVAPPVSVRHPSQLTSRIAPQSTAIIRWCALCAFPFPPWVPKLDDFGFCVRSFPRLSRPLVATPATASGIWGYLSGSSPCLKIAGVGLAG